MNAMWNEPNRHSRAMQRALQAIDRTTPQIIWRGHKDKARHSLRAERVIMTNRAYRIVDRWFRFKAYHNHMGKFFGGSTFEEPRVSEARIFMQSWKGIPEVKP